MRTNGSKFASQNKTFKVLIYTIILMSYFAADSLQIIREKMQNQGVFDVLSYTVEIDYS